MSARALALVLAVVSILVGGGAAGSHAVRAREAAATEPPPSPCIAETDASVRPDVVLVGEDVSVTLRVRVVCASEPYPLHVVLVMDGSASMDGASERQMRDAARHLVRSLAISEATARRGAVVQFDRTTRTWTPLTGEEERVLKAVSRVEARRPPDPSSPGPPVTAGPPVTSVPHTPGPGSTAVPTGDETAVDRGIADGYRELVAGRKRHPAPDEITEVMILLSDGHDPRGCRPALGEARNVKSNGVLVIAVCVGRGCDEGCMRQVASSPRYYFRAESAGALAGIFHQIRDRIVNISVRRLVIEETPADGLAYVPGSAAPPTESIDEPTGVLRWRFDYVPTDGVTVTYRSRAVTPGERRSARDSSGWFHDNRGRRGGFVFPNRWLSAWRPDGLAAPVLGPGPAPRPPILTPAAPWPTLPIRVP